MKTANVFPIVMLFVFFGLSIAGIAARVLLPGFPPLEFPRVVRYMALVTSAVVMSGAGGFLLGRRL